MVKDMERKQKRSEKAFTDALCELLLEKDLNHVYVRELCEKAGFSNMAFYSNYEDKYALAASVLQHEIDLKISDSYRIARKLADSGTYTHERMMYEISLTTFERVYRNECIYRCIFENRLTDSGIQYFASAVSKNYRKIFITDHADDMARYDSYLFELTTMNLLSTAYVWMKNDFDISARSLAKIYSSYITGFRSTVIDTEGKVIRMAISK